MPLSCHEILDYARKLWDGHQSAIKRENQWQRLGK